MTAFLIHLIYTIKNPNQLLNWLKVGVKKEEIETWMEVVHDVVQIRQIL